MKKALFANIPIFIPELACPHQCVFCDQEKISSHSSIPQPEQISTVIDEHLGTMNPDKQINIAFFGGNFTGIPISSQEAYLQAAFKYVKSGKVKGIRLSTRPDYVSPEILDMLQKYGVTTIEIGAQSTNENVLRKSGRGHTVDDIKRASKLILEYGFALGLQMMIGLPGDKYESSVETAEDIIELGASNTRIYPTLVIKDTALDHLYSAGKYSPLSLDEAVRWTKDIFRLFEENGVAILRVGLHPSEDLCDGKSLIVGPFHPSFKELVLTEIWSDILNEKLKSLQDHSIIIHVNPSQINYAIGHKSKNRNRLKEQGITAEFIGDNNLEKYEINVSNS